MPNWICDNGNVKSFSLADNNGRFTHHLQVCDPVFPPQVFLELWSHSREHIVEVHDDMNEGVDDSNEGAVTAGIIFHATPRNHWHHSVMVQVQESHLIIFLPKNEEYRV